MWVKKFLAPKNERPVWASVMELILEASLPKKPIVDKKARIN